MHEWNPYVRMQQRMQRGGGYRQREREREREREPASQPERQAGQGRYVDSHRAFPAPTVISPGQGVNNLRHGVLGHGNAACRFHGARAVARKHLVRKAGRRNNQNRRLYASFLHIDHDHDVLRAAGRLRVPRTETTRKKQAICQERPEEEILCTTDCLWTHGS